MTTTSAPPTRSAPARPDDAQRPSRPPRARRARPLVSHGSGFLVVALAFATAMAFSTVPTPLYPLYQARDGLPTVAVTVVFAAYAVGVAASLYLVGHLSDRFGRRRVLLLGLAAELVAAVLFLLLDGLSGLVVARLVSGVGIGAVTATATAHLAELRGPPAPAARRTRAPSRAWRTSAASRSARSSAGCSPRPRPRRSRRRTSPSPSC